MHNTTGFLVDGSAIFISIFLNCLLVLVDMCAGGQTVLTFSADRKKSARSSAGTAPQGIMGNR